MRWIAGEGLYNGTGDGFIYFPSAALLLTPFTLFSSAWGGTLWRLVNLGVFAAGCWRVSLSCSGNDPRRTFLACTLTTLPIAWSAARHGQMTLFSAGALMFGLIHLRERRLLRSSIALVLCVGLKPLFLPAVIILWVVFRELRKPLSVAFPVGFLATFIGQHPGYVASQWSAVLEMLRDVGDRAGGSGRSFVNLRGLVESLGGNDLEILPIVLCAGVITFLMARLVDHRVQGLAGERVPVIYLLTVGGTLLCSPATESNTYALVGPGIGWLATSWKDLDVRALRYVGFLVLPMVASRALAQAMPDTPLAFTKVVVTILLVIGAWSISPACSLRGAETQTGE